MSITTTRNIEYEALPGRVVCGPGRVGDVAAEVRRLGCARVLLIDGLEGAPTIGQVEAGLQGLLAETITDVRPHVPAALVASARAIAEGAAADCLLAVGGGSALGLAKALARESGLPIVAVPTTYAGSEMTPIWGITTDRRKTTGRDLAVLPRVVVYDPELTISLPPSVTAASGMNAVAHCVEAMWTPARNPVTDAVAAEGIGRLAKGLRASVRAPDDITARTEAQYGAWLAGTALAVAGTGLHHKLCHVLGGTFDLPHADVHAAVLPWVVDAFRDAAAGVLARVAHALGAEDAVDGLRALAADLGVGAGLAELGLSEVDADLAAELAAAGAPTEPVGVSEPAVRQILARAMSPETRPM